MKVNETTIKSVSSYSQAVTYTEGDIIIVTDENRVSKIYRVNNEVTGVSPSLGTSDYSLYSSTDDNIISGSEYLSGQKVFGNAMEVARYMVSHRFCIIRVEDGKLPGYTSPTGSFGYKSSITDADNSNPYFIVVSIDDGKRAYAMEMNGRLTLIAEYNGTPYVLQNATNPQVLPIANFSNARVLTAEGSSIINLNSEWKLTNLPFTHVDTDEVSDDDTSCKVRLYPSSITDLNNDQKLSAIKVFVEYSFENTGHDMRSPYQESVPIFINYPTNFTSTFKVQADGIFCRIICEVISNYYEIRAIKINQDGSETPRPFTNPHKIQIVGIVGLKSV